MTSSLLKVLTGGGKSSSSSHSAPNAPKIRKAELEAGNPAGDSTVDPEREDEDPVTAEERRRLKEQLQRCHDDLGNEACSALRAVVESTNEDWSTWDKTAQLVIDKRLSASGNFIGRGSFTWTPEQDYGLDAIEEFLWDQETKSLYDEFTEAMLVIVDYEGVDFHVVNQIFRPRFGISGRDFVLVIRKRREDDGDTDRLVIGAQSLPVEHLPQVESLIDEETAKKYYESGQKTVRGFVYIAGFVVERNKRTKGYKVTYVNDADVQSRGVPKWIVNRVKLDQLRIVEKIPTCLEAWLAEKSVAAVTEAAEAAEATQEESS